MMLKLKTCFTIFAVYEILAVILMHMTRICTAMFGSNFCADGGFKYFIACVAIPVLAFLIWMWICEIIHVSHRRHSLFYRTKSAVSDIMSDVKERVSESFSKADIEKYLTAAALIGIKKYSDGHPKMRRMVENIVAAAQGREMSHKDIDAHYEEDESDDYDEDEEYDDYNKNARGTTAKRRTTSAGTLRKTSYSHPIKKARKK